MKYNKFCNKTTLLRKKAVGVTNFLKDLALTAKINHMLIFFVINFFIIVEDSQFEMRILSPKNLNQ